MDVPEYRSVWPFDPREGTFEITGTMGEARGGTNGHRFHAGLDISNDEGRNVQALRDGVVASPTALSAFDTISESIRIGPIAYVHLRVGRRRGSDPTDASKFVASHDEHGKLVSVRVKRGARFSSGDFGAGCCRGILLRFAVEIFRGTVSGIAGFHFAGDIEFGPALYKQFTGGNFAVHFGSFVFIVLTLEALAAYTRSLVLTDIPSAAVAVGHPAKIVGDRRQAQPDPR